MLTEFLISLIPATGGIAYLIGNKKGHADGYNGAITEAKKEYELNLKTEIGIRDYEDHLNQVPGHICGQMCFEMMKVKTKIQGWKDDPYR